MDRFRTLERSPIRQKVVWAISALHDFLFFFAELYVWLPWCTHTEKIELTTVQICLPSGDSVNSRSLASSLSIALFARRELNIDNPALETFV